MELVGGVREMGRWLGGRVEWGEMNRWDGVGWGGGS
jgi:hypothetical protein